MQMNDEEVKKFFEGMVEYFDGRLPNPEHEPIRFKFYMKWYAWILDKRSKNG